MIEYIDHNWPEHNRWNSDDGDNTHRLNYELNNTSLVIDLGGYYGEWSEKIFNKYGCNIIIIEPVIEFYNEIVKYYNEHL